MRPHEAVSDPSRSVGIFDIVKIGICLAASFRGGCRAKRPARLDRIAVQANPAQELVFLVNDIRNRSAELWPGAIRMGIDNESDQAT